MMVTAGFVHYGFNGGNHLRVTKLNIYRTKMPEVNFIRSLQKISKNLFTILLQKKKYFLEQALYLSH